MGKGLSSDNIWPTILNHRLTKDLWQNCELSHKTKMKFKIWMMRLIVCVITNYKSDEYNLNMNKIMVHITWKLPHLVKESHTVVSCNFTYYFYHVCFREQNHPGSPSKPFVPFTSLGICLTICNLSATLSPIEKATSTSNPEIGHASVSCSHCCGLLRKFIHSTLYMPRWVLSWNVMHFLSSYIDILRTHIHPMCKVSFQKDSC